MELWILLRTKQTAINFFAMTLSLFFENWLLLDWTGKQIVIGGNSIFTVFNRNEGVELNKQNGYGCRDMVLRCRIICYALMVEFVFLEGGRYCHLIAYLMVLTLSHSYQTIKTPEVYKKDSHIKTIK